MSLPCTCRHRLVVHAGGRCSYAGCGCYGYRAATPTTVFETNALSYLTSHGICDVWVGWLTSRGHLTDADSRGRPPREDDVLDEDSLRLLPRHVFLEPREPPVMGVEAI